jgi:hypothetical protein
MSFDVGDPIPLSVTVRNASGVPENATTMVLTITLPDGTTTAPAVTGMAGVYTLTVPYFATQSGIHRVNWVATGTNACTNSDIFNVMAANPRFLISLDDARKALGTVAANTVKDEDLRVYVAAVTNIIEDVTGPILTLPGQVWTVDGGAAQVLLPAAVTSVQSVTDTGVTLTPVSDYTVNLRSGIVTRGTLLYPFRFLPGIQNVSVTYTVGGSTVPGNVALAARIILRQLWIVSGQQGNRPTMGSSDSSGTTPGRFMGFAIPAAALELLNSGPTDMPGFA